ncbi:MAG: hypothetical protein DSZ31_00145 [Gammaproteobacteria bacterium]|nr:MAG: hypothetical protein DSZ31_00145 [Gammaproteobacteria bacterium]
MHDLKRFKEGRCLFLGKNLIYLEKNSEYQNCKGVGVKIADFLLRSGEVYYLVEVKGLRFFKDLFEGDLKIALNRLRKLLKKDDLQKEIRKRIDDCLSECSKKSLKDLREKLKDSLLFLALNYDISRIGKLNYVVFLCPYEGKRFGYDIVLPLKDNLSRILQDSIKGFESCLGIPFEIKVAFWKDSKPFNKVLVSPFKVAVIDIGTYSTRITIAKIENESFQILYEEGRITALGKGVKQTKKLSKDAMEETLKVLKRYKKLCEEYGVEDTLVLGTEALRVAQNREEFVEKLQEMGFELKVISPWEEGKYAYLGAYFAVKPQGRVCVIDQGGGSTEFVYGKGLEVENVVSLPFGIVNLTERFIKNDPPTKEEIESLTNYLSGEISKLDKNVDTLVGLGGTITTLVALEYDIYPYDPAKVNGKTLTKERVKYWFDKLASMTVEERKKLPQIEDRRAEAIIPGIAIFWKTMELFGKEEIVVSDWAVKHGAIIANFLKIGSL